MNNNIYIKNARVYFEGKFENKSVAVKNGRIISLGKANSENLPELDAGGNMLMPGFIDIHTHGAVGEDVNLADENGFGKIAEFFASRGTTAFLASVLTDTRDNTLKILKTINRYISGQHENGAQLLGAHLEGPFLSKAKKGAMPEELIIDGNYELFESYLKCGNVKYITIAPECGNNLEFIKKISNKICVAVGHSQADYQTALRAVKNGAKVSTHTFNAMVGIDRVEPNLLGAVLDSDIYNEIIADGRHVHPSNIRLLYKAKGNRRMIAVTDSIQATGFGDGSYTLGEYAVTVKGADAYLTGTSVRAGSVLTVDKAFKNLMEFLHLAPCAIVPMFSENPALLFNLNKGFIKEGYDADFVIADDNIHIKYTIVNGKIVYRAK